MRPTGRPVAASAIAGFLNVELRGADIDLTGVSDWRAPRTGSMVFAAKDDPEVIGNLEATPGVFVIASEELAGRLSSVHVLAENPRLAFALATREYFLDPILPGVSSRALVDGAATLGLDVSIGPFAVIGAGVRIGDRTHVGAHVVIEAGCVIGSDCFIKPSTVIGGPGFGFETQGVPIRIPHLGHVVIGNSVEIGALCSVASGTLNDTTICDNTKIDDHVFIAHNVQIGERTLVIAGAEISGSVTIGDDAWIGPQATIRNHIEIGHGALVGMGAVVTRPVPAGAVVAGNPARVIRQRDPTDR